MGEKRKEFKRARKDTAFGRVLKIIGILTLLWTLIVNIPIPVRMDVSALEIRVRYPEYTVERTISIHGLYRINPTFGRWWFRGNIEVSGYPETRGEMSDLWTNRSRRGLRLQMGGLMDYRNDSPRGFYYLGQISSLTFFRNAIILVARDDTTVSFLDGETPVIVLRAENYEDAIRRMEIFTNFDLR
ncbi:MAG: hypothetical protein FWD01_01010 [Defluviitaleaceae bacterium]|nr:hypothetical protein [Defluviitaleaceae bacterium]